MRSPGILKLIAALIAGALTVLSFGPFNQYWMGIAGPAVLFHLWRGVPPRGAFLSGFAFGAGLFGLGVSWTYVSMNVYGNMPGPLAALAVILFVLLLALFPAAAGLLQAWSRAPDALRLTLVIPACWTLVEWIRGWFLTGFPWLSLGYGQIDGVLPNVAPWTGIFGVSLLSAVSSGLLVLVLASAGSGRRILGAAAFVLIWTAAWSAGLISHVRHSGDALRVAVVQGNIPLERKWQPDRQKSILDTYLGLSDGHQDRDVVVWPEAALPFFLDQLPAYFWSEVESHPAHLVTGILERSEVNGAERL